MSSCFTFRNQEMQVYMGWEVISLTESMFGQNRTDIFLIFVRWTAMFIICGPLMLRLTKTGGIKILITSGQTGHNTMKLPNVGTQRGHGNPEQPQEGKWPGFYFIWRLVTKMLNLKLTSNW